MELTELIEVQIRYRFARIPGVAQVDVWGGFNREVRIELDPDRIRAVGLPVDQVIDAVRDVTEFLQTVVAGAKAGEYRTGGNAYRILVQLKNAEKRTLDEILNLTLTTASGEKVALRNLVETESSRGPILIDRKDQQRQVTVQANVAGRDMESVAVDVQTQLNQIPRPVGYDLTVAGNFEEQQKSSWELIISLVLALVLIYMVLACQYESLPRSAGSDVFGSPGGDRRASDALFDGNHLKCAVLHRLHHAGRHRGQQCHFVGGPIGPLASGGCVRARGRDRSGPAALAAHHDDHFDHHPGPFTPGLGHRRGSRCSGAPGAGGCGRPGRIHLDHAGANSGGLRLVSFGSWPTQRGW